jgi:hypothetical protein
VVSQSATNGKMDSHHSSYPLGPANPSDIGDILRHKRKARPQRACQPCRLRKVKCSYGVPCQTCVERNHPELCSYDQSTKRPNTDTLFTRTQSDMHASAEDGEPWTPSKIEWTQMQRVLNSVSASLHEVQGSIQRVLDFKAFPLADKRGTLIEGPDHGRPEVHGVLASNVLTGEDVYVGGNSVPAMVIALSRDDGDNAVRELLSKSVLPIFGLDNESATYPFVDLWGVPHGSIRRLELLYSVLPNDADCHQMFRQYRDTAYVIFPVIVDILQFECSLTEFLTMRRDGLQFSAEGELVEQLVFGKDVHWLGLLFAVLASGLQCSDLPRKERHAKSQVYGTLLPEMSRFTLIDASLLCL